MKLSTGDWIQITTVIAVVLGLALVVLELRQSREIAIIQLATGADNARSALAQSIVGEDLAAAIAKSCQQPKELDSTEMEVLIAYYRNTFNTLTSLASIGKVDLLPEGTDLDQMIANFAHGILGTEIGRFWYEGNRDLWIARSFPHLAQTFDSTLAGYGQREPGWCLWKESNSAYFRRFEN